LADKANFGGSKEILNMVGLDDIKKKAEEAVDKTKDVAGQAGEEVKKAGETGKDVVEKSE
jgi:hypothetical protein